MDCGRLTSSAMKSLLLISYNVSILLSINLSLPFKLLQVIFYKPYRRKEKEHRHCFFISREVDPNKTSVDEAFLEIWKDNEDFISKRGPVVNGTETPACEQSEQSAGVLWVLARSLLKGKHVRLSTVKSVLGKHLVSFRHCLRSSCKE